MRLAPRIDSYPPLRSMHEADLLDIVRVEHCACDVYIRQLAGDSIVDVVRRHNATVEHRAWRYTPSSSDPTVVPGAVDVSNVPAMRPVGGRTA